jgi:hypothetical protein
LRALHLDLQAIGREREREKEREREREREGGRGRGRERDWALLGLLKSLIPTLLKYLLQQRHTL